MLSIALLLFTQLLTAQGLYYSEYPILPSYDRNIPADAKDNLDTVGVVVDKSSLQSHLQTLKLRTVGEYFKAGDYGLEFKGKKLCDRDITTTPAVYEVGTGSIIGSNRFITAYHVAEILTGLDNVKNLYIVFNYRQKITRDLWKQSVYQVEKVVDKSEQEDWVILKTKKGFTHNDGNRLQLASDIPSSKEPVYILGHPLGMPLRYASGQVLSVDPNLNIGLKFISSGFSGNSGSPVVRVRDGKIIALFTDYADGNDFALKKNCYDFKIRNPNDPVEINGVLSVKMRAASLNVIDNKHEEL